MNKHITKEDILILHKLMKSCSPSLPLGKLKLKHIRYHCTWIKMAKIKNYDATKCWRECQKKPIPHTLLLECEII